MVLSATELHAGCFRVDFVPRGIVPLWRVLLLLFFLYTIHPSLFFESRALSASMLSEVDFSLRCLTHGLGVYEVFWGMISIDYGWLRVD